MKMKRKGRKALAKCYSLSFLRKVLFDLNPSGHKKLVCGNSCQICLGMIE